MVSLFLSSPQFFTSPPLKVWKINPSIANNPLVIQKINDKINSLKALAHYPDYWLGLKENCIRIYKKAQTEETIQSKKLEEKIKALLMRINGSFDSDSSRNSFGSIQSIVTLDPDCKVLISEYERLLQDQMALKKIKAGINWDCGTEFPSRFLTQLIKKRESQKMYTESDIPSLVKCCQIKGTFTWLSLTSFQTFTKNNQPHPLNLNLFSKNGQ
jgi:hypothetical protein